MSPPSSGAAPEPGREAGAGVNAHQDNSVDELVGTLFVFASAIWEPDDLVEIRCLGAGDGQYRNWVKAADFGREPIARQLVASNSAGCNAYVGINPRLRQGGENADVALARCHFVDFDGCVSAEVAVRRIAEAGLPPPSLMVASGHGCHAYWRLTEAIHEMEEWRSRQKGLIAALGTDRVVHDPARIMRVPGLFNLKQAPPVRAILIEHHADRRYPVDKLRIGPSRTAPTATPSPAKGDRGQLSARTLRFIAQGAEAEHRNNELFTAACDMAGCGYSQEEAAAQLVGAAMRSPGDHPFTEAEGRAAIESAYGKSRAPAGPQWEVPRPLTTGPAPPPFPIDQAFPADLADIRAFVQAVAEALQIPIDAAAMALLPMVAVCVAQKFEAEVRPGWREVSALWVLVLLFSGERKSALFSLMSAPILAWEQEQALRLGPEIARAMESRRIEEARLANLRKEAAKPDSKEPDARQRALDLAEELQAMQVPHVPEIHTSDATTEALCGMLVNNHERGLVASPEADALDVMMGRYSERSTPNMGVWLKGHAGDSERVIRRSRPPEYLKRPVICVAMVVQPESVRDMFASRVARGRGLLARFLVSSPTSLVGHRKTGGAARPVPDHLRATYDRALRGLLDLEIDGRQGPAFVRLDADATALFNDFEAKVESQLGRAGSLGARADWGGKLCGAVARIGLVLYGLRCSLGGPSSAACASSAHLIDASIMRAALAWAPYLIDEERIVAGVVGCDPETAVADRALTWLMQSRLLTFTRRDCYMACRSAHVQQVEDIDAPLELLEELGYIRKQLAPAPRPGGGRPPSPTYLVNSLWARREGT